MRKKKKFEIEKFLKINYNNIYVWHALSHNIKSNFVDNTLMEIGISFNKKKININLMFKSLVITALKENHSILNIILASII